MESLTEISQRMRELDADLSAIREELARANAQPATRRQISVMVACLVAIAVSCAFLAVFLAIALPRIILLGNDIYSLLAAPI